MITTDDLRTAHLARIEDLGACLCNFDTLDAENAARCLMAGKPAYWYMGRTSAASYVVADANRAGSLLSTLISFEARNIRRASPLDLATGVLDNVIPLNDAAIDELRLCYRLQSTFREDVAGREREAIMHPSAQMSAYSDHAAIVRRFETRQAPVGKPVTNSRHALAIALASTAGAV